MQSRRPGLWDFFSLIGQILHPTVKTGRGAFRGPRLVRGPPPLEARTVGEYLGRPGLARVEDAGEDRARRARGEPPPRGSGEERGGSAASRSPGAVARSRAGRGGGPVFAEVPHEALRRTVVVGQARGGGPQQPRRARTEAAHHKEAEALVRFAHPRWRGAVRHLGQCGADREDAGHGTGRTGHSGVWRPAESIRVRLGSTEHELSGSTQRVAIGGPRLWSRLKVKGYPTPDSRESPIAHAEIGGAFWLMQGTVRR
jgi:hypothetical protein